jgi:hypothetical protein
MNQIIISQPAGDVKPQQSIPCHPCIVPGVVPVPMADESGAIVITLYPELGRRA